MEKALRLKQYPQLRFLSDQQVADLDDQQKAELRDILQRVDQDYNTLISTSQYRYVNGGNDSVAGVTNTGALAFAKIAGKTFYPFPFRPFVAVEVAYDKYSRLCVCIVAPHGLPDSFRYQAHFTEEMFGRDNAENVTVRAYRKSDDDDSKVLWAEHVTDGARLGHHGAGNSQLLNYSDRPVKEPTQLAVHKISGDGFLQQNPALSTVRTVGMGDAGFTDEVVFETWKGHTAQVSFLDHGYIPLQDLEGSKVMVKRRDGGYHYLDLAKLQGAEPQLFLKDYDWLETSVYLVAASGEVWQIDHYGDYPDHSFLGLFAPGFDFKSRLADLTRTFEDYQSKWLRQMKLLMAVGVESPAVLAAYSLMQFSESELKELNKAYLQTLAQQYWISIQPTTSAERAQRDNPQTLVRLKDDQSMRYGKQLRLLSAAEVAQVQQFLGQAEKAGHEIVPQTEI